MPSMLKASALQPNTDKDNNHFPNRPIEVSLIELTKMWNDYDWKNDPRFKREPKYSKWPFGRLTASDKTLPLANVFLGGDATNAYNDNSFSASAICIEFNDAGLKLIINYVSSYYETNKKMNYNCWELEKIRMVIFPGSPLVDIFSSFKRNGNNYSDNLELFEDESCVLSNAIGELWILFFSIINELGPGEKYKPIKKQNQEKLIWGKNCWQDYEVPFGVPSCIIQDPDFDPSEELQFETLYFVNGNATDVKKLLESANFQLEPLMGDKKDQQQNKNDISESTTHENHIWFSWATTVWVMDNSNFEADNIIDNAIKLSLASDHLKVVTFLSRIYATVLDPEYEKDIDPEQIRKLVYRNFRHEANFAVRSRSLTESDFGYYQQTLRRCRFDYFNDLVYRQGNMVIKVAQGKEEKQKRFISDRIEKSHKVATLTLGSLSVLTFVNLMLTAYNFRGGPRSETDVSISRGLCSKYVIILSAAFFVFSMMLYIPALIAVLKHLMKHEKKKM